jgi:small multidrug resistance family-3 protein
MPRAGRPVPAGLAAGAPARANLRVSYTGAQVDYAARQRSDLTARSVALFVVAAVAEIGGAYLMWQAVKEGRGVLFALAGAAALTGYGAVAALQPDANFGRVLAAYGGVFIIGSLLWGMALDGFRPDRFDLAGAALCLVGVTVIMYAPR